MIKTTNLVGTARINAIQLPLPVSLSDDETFASFYLGDNQLLVNSIQSHLQNVEFSSLYFWSSPSAGRTHLLHAACHQLSSYHKVSYIPLDQIASFSPEIVSGLEDYDLVCLDNIDAIAGHLFWQETLFDLFNRLYEKQKATLLITANAPPHQLGLTLPDLVSRLQWGPVFHLQQLKDDEKIAALQLRAALRGFELPVEVGTFLLKRVDRDMRELFILLDKLDTATISAKRKLTIPFVKEILNL